MHLSADKRPNHDFGLTLRKLGLIMRRPYLKNYYKELVTPWWRTALFLAGSIIAAFALGRLMGTMKLAGPDLPAGLFVVLGALAVSFAVMAALARNRSFRIAVAASLFALSIILVTAVFTTKETYGTAAYGNAEEGTNYEYALGKKNNDELTDLWVYWYKQAFLLWFFAIFGSVIGTGWAVLRGAGPSFGADLSIVEILFEDRKSLGLVIRSLFNPNVKDSSGMPFIFRAVRRDDFYTVFRNLLCGADTEVTDKKGNTPLHAAAWWKRPELARLLVIAGADVNARNFRQETPLHIAASTKGGDAVVAMLIKASADLGALDRRGFTPLAVACLGGGSETMLSMLVEAGADPASAMIAAVAGGKPRLIQRIVTIGGDPKIKDSKDDTLLHYAAEYCGAEVIRCLVKIGVDPIARNNQGETAGDILEKRYAKENVHWVRETLREYWPENHLRCG